MFLGQMLNTAFPTCTLQKSPEQRQIRTEWTWCLGTERKFFQEVQRGKLKKTHFINNNKTETEHLTLNVTFRLGIPQTR